MLEISERMKQYIEQARKEAEEREKIIAIMKSKKFDTIAIHGMYSIEEAISNGHGGIVEPIILASAQACRDSDELEAYQAYLIPGWTYSRIQNPTVSHLEDTLSLLETYGTDCDATAVCTSSGMSAIKQAIEPLVARVGKRDDFINIVSSAKIYGGTFQLFNVRMKERGVTVRWVSKPWDIDEWSKLIDDDTRFVYGEMPSNPQQVCFDIAEVVKLAHQYEIPFVIDSTLATPALMRPIQYGADIVVHSLTKTIGAAGAAIGGALIAKHNMVCKYLSDDIKKDYGAWVKLWPARDSGACMSPYSAFYFLQELRTLRVRMKLFSENAMKVAKYLDRHPRVESVDYLGLEKNFLNAIAKKYMQVVDSGEEAYGHLMSFVVKGEAKDARKFLDNLKQIIIATDLGRIKSLAIIPAISTHLQQGPEGRKLAGIPDTMVRLCVGGEHPDDIIDDIEQALAKI